METANYKVIGLKVDGMRKLRAVEMKFTNKGLIKIIGQNRAGKTTILESLAVLIGGKKYLKDGAINPEAERITMLGSIGEFEIYREFYEGKAPILKVTGRDGSIIKGEVQQLLSAITNSLTLSPLPFIQLTPLEKVRFLMKLYNLDFTEIDKQLTTLENDRLYIGRKIKEYGVLVEPERVLAVDTTDLMNQRKAITDRNELKRQAFDAEKTKKRQEIDVFNEIQQMRSTLISRLTATAENLADRIGNMKNTDPLNELHRTDQNKQVEVLHEIHQTMLAGIAKLPKADPSKVFDLFSLPEPLYESVNEIDTSIQMANATNLKADIYQKYVDKLAEKNRQLAEYTRLSDEIEAFRDEKVRILAATDTKVEGLEIRFDKEKDELGVYYNNIDTENLSDAENMTLSLKLCSAMMPDLRAVFIDRGESIDIASQQALHTWAIENDMQLIMSVVDDIPKDPLFREENCFYIVDGQLI